MKRSNIGIQDIATFENAEDAYRKARRCKRYREEVLIFTDNLEEELYSLVDDLSSGTYRQGKARRFVIYEPKKRDIYALPFRDRVAQHAGKHCLCTGSSRADCGGGGYKRTDFLILVTSNDKYT